MMLRSPGCVCIGTTNQTRSRCSLVIFLCRPGMILSAFVGFIYESEGRSFICYGTHAF
jgi:hypothetical protein